MYILFSLCIAICLRGISIHPIWVNYCINHLGQLILQKTLQPTNNDVQKYSHTYDVLLIFDWLDILVYI